MTLSIVLDRRWTPCSLHKKLVPMETGVQFNYCPLGSVLKTVKKLVGAEKYATSFSNTLFLMSRFGKIKILKSFTRCG